jgi:hypothetical protein
MKAIENDLDQIIANSTKNISNLEKEKPIKENLVKKNQKKNIVKKKSVNFIEEIQKLNYKY